MRLEIDFARSYCTTDVFVINGVDADIYDFCEKVDTDQEQAEEYGCGNMTATKIPPKQEVLVKYGITIPEYELVAGQIELGLSFGHCSLCV